MFGFLSFFSWGRGEAPPPEVLLFFALPARPETTRLIIKLLFLFLREFLKYFYRTMAFK
jgi:hypothetical protein